MSKELIEYFKEIKVYATKEINRLQGVEKWAYKGGMYGMVKNIHMGGIGHDYFETPELATKARKQVKLTLLLEHLANDFNGGGRLYYQIDRSNDEIWQPRFIPFGEYSVFSGRGAEKACEILNSQPELWSDLI